MTASRQPQAAPRRSGRKRASALSILLWIAGSCALLVLGGYVWLQKNGKQLAEHLKELTHQAAIEGSRYGDGKTGADCVSEAMERSRNISGFSLSAEVSNQSFLSACLSTAVEPPGFCAGVPPESAILKTVSWRLAVCEKAGRHDQPCTRLVRAIQTYCATKR